MLIDNEKITEAILATGAGPLALEEGAALVEHWIQANARDVDRGIVAVECGFVYWLDTNTVIIGVQDLITEIPMAHLSEEERLVLGRSTGVLYEGWEWKTTGAKSEADWLNDIVDGSQIGIYALAMSGATYYPKGGEPVYIETDQPRVHVRAIKKSVPPVVWPKREADGLITFGPERLKYIKNALLAKAAAIRAMRKAGAVPWQLPGIWCTNKYRRTCEYYADCSAQRLPEAWSSFDINDPGFSLAAPHIGRDLNDPELVILGASAYAAYSECLEKGRRNTLAGNREDSLALQTGTVLHGGIAEFYRQIQADQQKKIDSLTSSE